MEQASDFAAAQAFGKARAGSSTKSSILETVDQLHDHDAAYDEGSLIYKTWFPLSHPLYVTELRNFCVRILLIVKMLSNHNTAHRYQTISLSEFPCIGCKLFIFLFCYNSVSVCCIYFVAQQLLNDWVQGQLHVANDHSIEDAIWSDEENTNGHNNFEPSIQNIIQQTDAGALSMEGT